MKAKGTEVVITYKEHPHAIFPDTEDQANNRRIIRLQPNEGIELEMFSKSRA